MHITRSSTATLTHPGTKIGSSRGQAIDSSSLASRQHPGDRKHRDVETFSNFSHEAQLTSWVMKDLVEILTAPGLIETALTLLFLNLQLGNSNWWYIYIHKTLRLCRLVWQKTTIKPWAQNPVKMFSFFTARQVFCAKHKKAHLWWILLGRADWLIILHKQTALVGQSYTQC